MSALISTAGVAGEIKEQLAKLLNGLDWADARHGVPHHEEGKGRSRIGA